MYGSKKGIDSALHLLRASFKNTESESMLLIETENAFNILNGDLELRNIENLCPSFYHFKCKSNREPANFFIDEQKLLSGKYNTRWYLCHVNVCIAIIPIIEFLENWFTV